MFVNCDRRVHVPVMSSEVLTHLSPQSGETYLDATFGQGGHSRLILQKAQCSLFACDRDSIAELPAETLKMESEQSVTMGDFIGFSCSRFGNIQETLEQHKIGRLDGILADFGVSSPQIDDPKRGFSFREDGPLDMRMGDNEISAQEFIASISESDLYYTIKLYGDEPFARRIARAIVNYRKNSPIETTAVLAHIVRVAVPNRRPRSRMAIDPATKTFQAIRIAVNKELDDIRSFLEAVPALLKPGGRLVVISFHSLEDRVVKNFLRHACGHRASISRHLPSFDHSPESLFSLPFKKPLTPSDEEVQKNPRARSARMRVAIRN